jgi:transposase
MLYRRIQAQAKAFHNRLKAAGKLHKLVIVAVMRKMSTMLNATVRR